MLPSPPSFLHREVKRGCPTEAHKGRSLATMPETVAVNPELLRWAIDRSRLTRSDLAEAFPKLDEWLNGQRQPTYRQLERFAHKTMTPLGYLYLDKPPEEHLDIPDFRTVDDT